MTFKMDKHFGIEKIAKMTYLCGTNGVLLNN